MNAERADVADVWSAFRLLLGRTPDAEGMATYKKLVLEHALSPTDLARHFLGSNEFRSRYNSDLLEVELDGFVLMVRADDVDVGQTVARDRKYEVHVASALRQHLHEGDIFLDVGANIGYFTAMASRLVGDSGRVFAVEPMDKNVQLLYATIERNGFLRVEVHPFAASDDVRIVHMGTTAGSSNGEIMRESGRGARPLYAQARRLDQLLSDCARIDVAKFDIEGHELNAWRGFERGLQRCRPIIFTEFHPACMRRNAGVDPLDYATILKDYGKVTVLRFDGTTLACPDADAIMRAWAHEDAALGANGKAHIDLLILPRHRD